VITADRIREYTNLSTEQLTEMIQKFYPRDRFQDSRFLGITNGHQFCYSVTYYDTNLEEDCQGKVFVSQDGTADY
jgi:DNA-directed RNA polymerase delta subunit